MIKNMSLRSLLLLAMVIVVLVPMVLIAVFAIPAYSNSLRAEAGKTLSTHAAVGRDKLNQLSAVHTMQMSSLGVATEGNLDRDGLADKLKVQSALLGYNFMFWVDPQGLVHSSDTGGVTHRLDWPLLDRFVGSVETTTFIAVVPPTELSALGEGANLEILPKAGPGGTATPAELVGALSVVSITPIKQSGGAPVGIIVGVDSLKGDQQFVDSITAELGGEATVFQNGVRVATTVTDKTGARAIGTPVSDVVRKAVLVGGTSYRGFADVVGMKHLAVYEPLRDPDGNVVGMFFVGLPYKPYSDAVGRFALNFLLVLVGGLVLAVGLAWGAAGTIARPLSRMRDGAARVADGDLHSTVPEEGFKEAIQLGASFNGMTSALREILSRVGASAGRLDSVSGEIAVVSAGSAETAGSQASAVAEASATVEEITRSFGAVAEGAQRVLDIAEDSLEVAQSGRGTIEESAGAIDRLADGTVQVEEAARRLAEVADTIDHITIVINSIAEQTKILALNAAIEAARAGDAGKGFGVVSTEIRTLANSVSASVSQIGGLVAGIQSASKSLTTTAAEQAELATNTVNASSRTRASFDDILEQMGRTAAAAREIASAATQQQMAAHQIVEVMQQVSAGVSESAASSRQLAHSAGDVRSEAEGLQKGLGRFRM